MSRRRASETRKYDWSPCFFLFNVLINVVTNIIKKHRIMMELVSIFIESHNQFSTSVLELGVEYGCVELVIFVIYILFRNRIEMP